MANEPPPIIYWRLPNGRSLHTILGPAAMVKEALSRDHDRTRPNRTVLRQCIPYGVTGWRAAESESWRPLKELPPEWGLKRAESDEREVAFEDQML